MGYNPENLPFSFINDRGHLVGFDIELIHMMAKELGVDVAFIPWDYQTGIEMLDRCQFDIAIGGLIVTPTRLTQINFSRPYMDMTLAVVVEDYRRHEFTSWHELSEQPDLRLGAVGKNMAKDAHTYLANTDIIPMKSPDEFFKDNPDHLDAMLTTAEAGSAWTILYPAYSVVVPEPYLKLQAAFAMPLCDSGFENFVNAWLEMKKTPGVIHKLYDKWILGKEVEQKKRRWSIGRDVFGWWE